jgi:hypothetical protein
VGKLLAIGGAAIAVSALTSYIAIKSRKGNSTEIRYTAPFHFQGPAGTAAQLTISPATTLWLSATGEPYSMGF